MAHLEINRRDFGRLVLIGGIGVAFAGCGLRPSADYLSPEWWVELHRDGRVRMLTKRVEIGQGAHPLRLSACPRIEVILVPSDNRICGVGEIVTPAAIAAVSNAISRLTGQRVRR